MFSKEPWQLKTKEPMEQIAEAIELQSNCHSSDGISDDPLTTLKGKS